MPRKTEIIETIYRGVAADGEIVKESKSKTTVERYMRHHPQGTIETRHLVGYYTPWTPVETKKADK
jgi:hypothetical protein